MYFILCWILLNFNYAIMLYVIAIFYVIIRLYDVINIQRIQAQT
jgi:hypothetical protein